MHIPPITDELVDRALNDQDAQAQFTLIRILDLIARRAARDLAPEDVVRRRHIHTCLRCSLGLPPRAFPSKWQNFFERSPLFSHFARHGHAGVRRLVRAKAVVVDTRWLGNREVAAWFTWFKKFVRVLRRAS